MLELCELHEHMGEAMSKTLAGNYISGEILTIKKQQQQQQKVIKKC